MSKLNRTIESYAACIAIQVAGGSPAQTMFFIIDAKADIATLAAENERLRADAERYSWLRDPNTDVSLVIDKVCGEIPYHEGTQTGGYLTYEYRSGDELDAAIDQARAALKEG